jgi:hypothetical protein
VLQYITAPWCVVVYKQHIRAMRKREMIQRYRTARYIDDLETKLEQLEAVRRLLPL